MTRRSDLTEKYGKDWWKNPELVRLRNRDYYQENRGRISQAHRLRIHGITVTQFLELLKEQDYKCAICETEIDETFGRSRDRTGQAIIDHCHKTGKIRGLLCHHCNCGIGHMSDDPTRLEKAVAYLRKC